MIKRILAAASLVSLLLAVPALAENSEVVGASVGQVEEVADDPAAVVLVGRFHPLLVHLPIGWLLLLLFVEAQAHVWRRPGWEGFGRVLLLATLLALVPTVVSGLVLSRAEDPADLVDVHRHRNVAFGCAVAVALAAAVRLRTPGILEGKRRGAYLGLLGIAGALLAAAAHFGASMVHGKDYLSP